MSTRVLPDKKTITQLIEDAEYYSNGFNKLSGYFVRAVNVKVSEKQNTVVADVYYHRGEEGGYEKVSGMEVKLDALLGFYTSQHTLEEWKKSRSRNDTLLCVAVGCVNIQAEDGEYCEEHSK